MLEAQRQREERIAELRASGVSTAAARDLTRDERAFRPAYINGKRVGSDTDAPPPEEPCATGSTPIEE